MGSKGSKPQNTGRGRSQTELPRQTNRTTVGSLTPPSNQLPGTDTKAINDNSTNTNANANGNANNATNGETTINGTQPAAQKEDSSTYSSSEDDEDDDEDESEDEENVGDDENNKPNSSNVENNNTTNTNTNNNNNETSSKDPQKNIKSSKLTPIANSTNIRISQEVREGSDQEDLDPGNEEDHDYYDDDDYGFINEDNGYANTTRNALTTSGLMEAREAKVQEVADVLCIEAHIAQALLNHFKWDKEKLLEQYMDNAKKVLKQAGISRRQLKPKGKSKRGPKISSIECSICFDTISEEQGFSGLSCKHYFCNGCWDDYLSTNIKEGKSFEICCMQKGCNILVPEHVVRQIVNKQIFEKYMKFISASFVESSKDFRWCPRPGCGNAVTSPSRETGCLVGKCSCGHKFCFDCNTDAHSPAACPQVKLWAKKCEDDSETFNWIASNTKPCPKCKVLIEKNDGCFQMTCRQCRFQWCWLCCEDWKTHSDHFTCNKYKGKLQNKPEWTEGGSKDDQRSALDRYLHYYNRYINHSNSIKFEDKRREAAKAKMAELLNQRNENFYYNVTFIEEALEQLLQCRQTLKWTYVYAYFAEDPVKKDLFEMGQGDLERITEKLTRMLEQPVDKISNTEIRSLTKVAQKSLRQLFLNDSDEFGI
eukprot:TRINITY_DN173_c0_g1_i1.p1 TRINITY_DN173_c0_g1~~TRINITY_DN173_c0_g1_i1.p1  ORF type:complete len:652 (-),score=296.92 TRINITY_DN173_c0_g1_i1:121-2076(-)